MNETYYLAIGLLAALRAAWWQTTEQEEVVGWFDHLLAALSEDALESFATELPHDAMDRDIFSWVRAHRAASEVSDIVGGRGELALARNRLAAQEDKALVDARASWIHERAVEHVARISGDGRVSRFLTEPSFSFREAAHLARTRTDAVKKVVRQILPTFSLRHLECAHQAPN